MRKETFAIGECYHIFNRGVNSSDIFLCGKDYRRFYESLFLFNNENYSHVKGDRIEDEVIMATTDILGDYRVAKVSILAFCLLPNHFHLFVRQESESGISSFMQQVAKGYAQYINKKYDRTGPLFDGRFQAVHVENEAHYRHLPRYIHLNALDLLGIHWRYGQIKDWNRAKAFLDDYVWSSHGLYSDRKQLLPVVNEDLVSGFFTDIHDYNKFLALWSGRLVLDRDKDSSL